MIDLRYLKKVIRFGQQHLLALVLQTLISSNGPERAGVPGVLLTDVVQPSYTYPFLYSPHWLILSLGANLFFFHIISFCIMTILFS